MPFAAYWALITSATTSRYSIIAFISLTWSLCPHQISPLWLCPLFLYKVSTLHGDLSSSHLSLNFLDYSKACRTCLLCVSLCSPVPAIMGSTRARMDQWHSDSGFNQCTLTWLEETWSIHQHFIVRVKKPSHTHCWAVINPQMPIQSYLIKFS